MLKANFAKNFLSQLHNKSLYYNIFNYEYSKKQSNLCGHYINLFTHELRWLKSLL